MSVYEKQTIPFKIQVQLCLTGPTPSILMYSDCIACNTQAKSKQNLFGLSLL